MKPETLQAICEGENCQSTSCLLREMVAHSGLSDRNAIQVKAVEIHKWNLSARAGQDVGWRTAWEDWTNKDYARVFASIYREGMKAKEAYDETMIGVAE